LQENFETLISSYIDNNIGICNQFLSENLASRLAIHLLALNEMELLILAGVGNLEKTTYNNKVRSDSIYWLDRKNNNIDEIEFLDLMEGFINYLNRTCYAGITGYEFHYSIYEIGSFYIKHLDQFQNKSSRKYSMISYLNKDWKIEDGGQLLIHKIDNNQKISPNEGKTVFFKSNEIEHEVLITNKRRISIAGWLLA
jgi:Rps23 Pro-64 3,4-dihydroxylase Tpa1-like proline 4-hydroxylase